MTEVKNEVKSEMYIKKQRKERTELQLKVRARGEKREVACIGTKRWKSWLAASSERDSERTKALAKRPENKK